MKIMKKTRHAIGLALCIIICIMLAAGCGNGGGSSNTTTSQSPGSSQSAGNASTTPGSSSSSSPTTSVAPDRVAAPEPPPPEAEYYDHFTFATAQFQTLDLFNPAVGNAALAYYVQNVHDYFIKKTPEGKFEPELATEWSTEDGKTIYFKFRDDVYFHNGEKFTTADIVWTIEKGLESPGSGMYSRWSELESWEVINDYEMTFTFKNPNVDYEYWYSVQTAAILNRKAYEADSEKGSWVGTGPWIVTDFMSNSYIKFERNENYWDPELIPITKTMTFQTVTENLAGLIMMESDDADLFTLASTDIPTYRDDPRFTIWSYNMDNLNCIYFNFMNPIIADINFRMAVAHCYSREDALAIAIGGYGIVAEGQNIWGKNTEFRNPNIPRIPVDLDLAKEYLDKSIYKGETIRAIAAMAHPIANAQVLQENLKQIGVTLEIYETDPPTMTSMTGWGVGDADIILNSSVWGSAASCKSYFYPELRGNACNYTNDRVTELIDLGSSILDKAERQKIYYELQEIIAEEVPMLPLYHMSLYFMGQKGVGGILFYSDNQHDLSQAYRIKNP